MPVGIVTGAEFERIDDLLHEYFTRVREYNIMLGAFDMTAPMLADAARREALSYDKVRRAKERLLACGIHI